MSDYCTTDFAAYSELFRKRATVVVGLMRILDEKITTELEIATMRPKDLFRMVMDMTYEVDKMYKKENNIEEESFFVDSFITKDETISKVRSMLQEEFKRYLGGDDE